MSARDIKEKRNTDQKFSLLTELCHLLADDGKDPKLKYKPESNCSIFVNDTGKDWD